VTKDGLRYREGAVAGEKIKLFFNELVRTDLGERSIEELPIPLTLIATDIGTGERVAMRDGNLTSAMRASMSVPGAIAPAVRNGRKLVDGGLVDNVPIQEVRERCGAEVVIAVNVARRSSGPEVTGLVSVVGQMVNLLTEQNVAKSLSLLGPGDIYLKPELGSITAADFTRQLEAASGEKGRAGARTRCGAAVGPVEYREWRARVRQDGDGAGDRRIRVAATRFVNPAEMRDGAARQPSTQALAEASCASTAAATCTTSTIRSCANATRRSSGSRRSRNHGGRTIASG
jgi:NTE family protein